MKLNNFSIGLRSGVYSFLLYFIVYLIISYSSIESAIILDKLFQFGFFWILGGVWFGMIVAGIITLFFFENKKSHGFKKFNWRLFIANVLVACVVFILCFIAELIISESVLISFFGIRPFGPPS